MPHSHSNAQGLPKQNGETNIAAGDRLAEVRASLTCKGSVSCYCYCRKNLVHTTHSCRRGHVRQGLRWQRFADNPVKHGQEATFALKTNDPAGFNLIDVFAWYALPHATISPPDEVHRMCGRPNVTLQNIKVVGANAGAPLVTLWLTSSWQHRPSTLPAVDLTPSPSEHMFVC